MLGVLFVPVQPEKLGDRGVFDAMQLVTLLELQVKFVDPPLGGNEFGDAVKVTVATGAVTVTVV